MMRGLIAERVIYVGLIAIVAITGAGAITFESVQSLSDASWWVNRTEGVRFSLQRTLSTMQDAESAVRGYFITHEEPFLEPYNHARANLDSNLKTLTDLLADSPAQLERARELDHLARARLDRLDTGVTAMRAGTFVMPKAPLASSEAKRLMDSFRAQIAVMQSVEDQSLAKRLADATNARRIALICPVGMSAI